LSLDVVANGVAARRAREAAQEGLAFKFGAELRRCRKDTGAPGLGSDPAARGADL